MRQIFNGRTRNEAYLFIVRSGSPILRPPEGRSDYGQGNDNTHDVTTCFSARKRYRTRPAPLFCILFSGKTGKSMSAKRQLQRHCKNGTSGESGKEPSASSGCGPLCASGAALRPPGAKEASPQRVDEKRRLSAALFYSLRLVRTSARRSFASASWISAPDRRSLCASVSCARVSALCARS